MTIIAPTTLPRRRDNAGRGLILPASNYKSWRPPSKGTATLTCPQERRLLCGPTSQRPESGFGSRTAELNGEREKGTSKQSCAKTASGLNSMGSCNHMMTCTQGIPTTIGQPRASPPLLSPPRAFLSSTLWMSILYPHKVCFPHPTPSPPWACPLAWCPLQSRGCQAPASTAWITWTTWATLLWILPCQRQLALMPLQHPPMSTGTHVTPAWQALDSKLSSTLVLDMPVFRTLDPISVRVNMLWTDPCDVYMCMYVYYMGTILFSKTYHMWTLYNKGENKILNCKTQVSWLHEIGCSGHWVYIYMYMDTFDWIWNFNVTLKLVHFFLKFSIVKMDWKDVHILKCQINFISSSCRSYDLYSVKYAPGFKIKHAMGENQNLPPDDCI